MPAGYSTGGRASEGLHRIFGVPAARGARYVFQFLVPFPPPVSLGRDPVLPRVFLLLPRDHRRAGRPAAPLLTYHLRRSTDRRRPNEGKYSLFNPVIIAFLN